MPSHHFLFTYSVSPVNENLRSHRDSSDDMRRKIAKIKQVSWNKLTLVETAFIGEVYLIRGTTDDKRAEAQDDIYKVIEALLREHQAYAQVRVDIALMVDGLGECIEFCV
ncbi:hypothetical protein [Acinetobacter sp. TUM15064]|uniref:hypothetical protein n=1 Tax=Acinetobacter sp. TUM15064 TaxID=2609134 RepID=UPI00124F43FA|nr:hypothetical protein [Acinetobacter sp. TUM15064]